MHYKRRSSFIQEQRAKQMLEPLEELEVDVVDGSPRTRPPRRKAASVCVAMVTMKPETSSQYEYELPHTCAARKFGATSRFTVERNCQPLTLQEFQNVRLRGLSTSEVFHEPPKMYVYRERPVTYPYRKPKKPTSLLAFIKKRRHTLCAWVFGISAVVVMTTIIILQTKGDFS
ncbi:hypothetical protein ANCCAN_15425 [Ancylostoma caninum]|uniref:Uncharacterized protein n=1 Tax=Ancylostoma caninum TaxID=29170 RepID=A0A368G7H8_ANCCA|nr:hypothetical protein ANCCAN_15425 [Ancylostoma caninum]